MYVYVDAAGSSNLEWKSGEAIVIFKNIGNRVFRVSKANITDFLENVFGSLPFLFQIWAPCSIHLHIIKFEKF